MKRLKRKLAVNGMATILSVIFILSMVAAPVIASVTANSVDGSSIVDRSIQTIDLALGSVKTGILGNNAVTSAKIKDREVKTADLAVGAVGTGRIKNGAVTGAKIRDYTITKEDLKSASVNSVKVEDGSILARDIANGAVNSAKIANGTITNADIAGSAAISDSKISYDTIKTGSLSIPPSAFIPNKLVNTYAHNAGFFLYSTASGTRRFYAPVHLPEGAKITKVTFETRDNSASYKLSWKLVRRYTSGITTNLGVMATANTTNASQVSPWQQLTDTSILNNVIDNSSNSYFVEAVFNGSTTSSVRVGRVLIEYTYTSPGS